MPFHPSLAIDVFDSAMMSKKEISSLVDISKQNAAQYHQASLNLLNQLFINPGKQKKLNQENNSQQKILIFVSFSMPKESLKQWLLQAEKNSAPVLLRGFKNNSLRETLSEFQSIQSETKSGIQIDPISFEKFGVTKVPAVVIQQADKNNENNFDVIYGDVGLEPILNWLHQHKKMNGIKK